VRFLADESCDFAIVRALRTAGFDVAAVVDISPRASDQSVIDVAVQQDRVLLTEDKDFGQLVYASGQPSAGVILLRFPAGVRSQMAAAVLDLLSRHGDAGPPLRIDPAGIEMCRRLRTSIPPDQQVRVAGKLDVLQHTERMFTLILESGALVRGVAKFRPSGSVLRIDAESVEAADERDLSLWAAPPRPVFGPLDERTLRQPQGSRSGVAAIFGQLSDDESDEEIIEALDRLS